MQYIRNGYKSNILKSSRRLTKKSNIGRTNVPINIPKNSVVI